MIANICSDPHARLTTACYNSCRSRLCKEAEHVRNICTIHTLKANVCSSTQLTCIMRAHVACQLKRNIDTAAAADQQPVAAHTSCIMATLQALRSLADRSTTLNCSALHAACVGFLLIQQIHTLHLKNNALPHHHIHLTAQSFSMVQVPTMHSMPVTHWQLCMHILSSAQSPRDLKPQQAASHTQTGSHQLRC
jgi:hypothetical protein